MMIVLLVVLCIIDALSLCIAASDCYTLHRALRRQNQEAKELEDQ